jgi:DNA-binding transcriptional regulator YiaG
MVLRMSEVSQHRIGQHFGVHQGTISRWLSGRSRMPEGAIAKILAVLRAERRRAAGAR